MSARPQFELALRRMELADLDRVMRIEQSAHKHPWSPELMRRELDHDWSRIIVADETQLLPGQPPQTHLLGYIVFWLVHDEVHVLNVATDPAFRRRGAGRALMRASEDYGRERGAVLSTLEVRRSNEPAITLYLQLGYRQVGVRARYYQEDGEDALVMVKDLPRET